MIPESFIENLKEHCDIQQTISSYVDLKRGGRTWKGICPFHSEKSPSFVVYPDNQSFYCFGCGIGGDVVTFVRKIENLDYIEALKFLAQHNGIAFPEDQVDDQATRLKQEILEINRETARFFHQQLREEVGQKALEYLLQRGISGKTIGKFGLGYAPAGWDNLKKHLQQKRFSEYAMLSAAVITTSSKGKNSYDAFRNRVMFPILDLRGNVVGFGGRIMDGDGPKYLNSSDTPVFKKSKHLFALNLAKTTKEKSLILAEGYMDVIALHQAGFDNAVATLGTALTGEQVRVIGNYASEVRIAYDSDDAGQKATTRAIKLFEETGTKVKIIAISDAKDPDEFIKKFGAARFRLLLEGSAGATDYAVDRMLQKYATDTADGKVMFLKEFCDYLSDGIGSIERDIYIGKIGDMLGVSKDAIREQVDAVRKRRWKQKKNAQKRDIKLFSEQLPQKQRDFDRTKKIRYALAEDGLMVALIKNQDYFHKISFPPPEEFVTQSNREIYQILYDRLCLGKSIDLTNLSGELTQEQLSHLSYLLSNVLGDNLDQKQTEEYIQILHSFDTLADPTQALTKTDNELMDYINGLGQKKK